jgi:hypothetical protein
LLCRRFITAKRVGQELGQVHHLYSGRWLWSFLRARKAAPRSAESKAVSRTEGEEPEHPLHPRAWSTRVAQTLMLQQAQHGRERDLPIQADHRPSREKSYPGRTTGGSAARVQDSQHDAPSRNARQLRCGVIPLAGTGDLSSAPSHAPTPLRVWTLILDKPVYCPPPAPDRNVSGVVCV